MPKDIKRQTRNARNEWIGQNCNDLDENILASDAFKMPTRSKQNRRVPIEHTDGRLLGESFEFLERLPK